MRFRSFGDDGRRVPVIGQGTWQMEAYQSAAVEALRKGIDSGLSHIDTAESYGNGRVEELVGSAIEGRRENVFLVSKILPRNATRDGTIAACQASLRRLGTDYLDCLLLHWVSEHPLEETVAGFERLRERGMIRCWGVSNFDEQKLGELLSVADASRVACNQVLYHLEERSIEHAVIPFCEAQGISVVGYSALGSGRFPSARRESGRLLVDLALARNATPQQLALAFLLHRASFVLVRSIRPDHIEHNAAASEIELTDDELLQIQRAFPRGPRRFGVPTR